MNIKHYSFDRMTVERYQISKDKFPWHLMQWKKQNMQWKDKKK